MALILTRILSSRFVLLTAVLWVGMAACGDSGKHVETGTSGAFRGAPFPPGSVGSEASRFALTMSGVRKWYEVMNDLSNHARSDSTFHLKVNFDLASPLTPYATGIEADSGVANTLRARNLDANQFVLLTALIGAGLTTLHVADSLGSASPAPVDPVLLTFFRNHRREIDSLSATLPKI